MWSYSLLPKTNQLLTNIISKPHFVTIKYPVALSDCSLSNPKNMTDHIFTISRRKQAPNQSLEGLISAEPVFSVTNYKNLYRFGLA